MLVLPYIIKITLLPLGRFRSALDICTALLNKSNLFIAIKNATLGLVVPGWLVYLNVYSHRRFRVALLRMSLSELPRCGNACFILFIIVDNPFPWDLCLCLSPLSLEIQNCSKCYLQLKVVSLPLNFSSFLSWFSRLFVATAAAIVVAAAVLLVTWPLEFIAIPRNS